MVIWFVLCWLEVIWFLYIKWKLVIKGCKWLIKKNNVIIGKMFNWIFKVLLVEVRVIDGDKLNVLLILLCRFSYNILIEGVYVV